MAMLYEMSKPTIRILHNSQAVAETVRQLQYGMEEEGVPCEVDTATGMDAVEMAWEAANASRLSVGVGLDGQRLVLHFSKLEPSYPLLQLPARSDVMQIRALGSNAARLVKKLPLKPLDRR